jgi:hypothetical protein
MKKKTAQLEVRKTKRTLQCKFTPPEILQLGKDLAEKTNLARQIEAEKKQVVKQFDARLAEVEAQINQASNNIQAGYEYRTVDCTETIGEPDESKKTVRRLDLGEIIEIRELSSEEKQRALEFENAQEEKE